MAFLSSFSIYANEFVSKSEPSRIPNSTILFRGYLERKNTGKVFHSASITPAIGLSLPAKKYLAIFYYRDSTLVLLAVSKLVTQGKYGTDYKTTLF